MIKNGEKTELTQDMLDVIATYMNDIIREDVHFDLAPCNPETFLGEYLKRDPGFEALLREEFGIEMKVEYE